MARDATSTMSPAEKFKLDLAFFQQMIREKPGIPQDLQDFDIYLMEQSVMPTLLQGLDALSRHVDRMVVSQVGGTSGGQLDPDAMLRFNPLIWLAQFLLRNHPRHVRDDRKELYAAFRELASIERGRRYFLRQRDHMEEVWAAMQYDLRSRKQRMSVDHMPEYFQRLDSSWYLNGSFVEKMPNSVQGELDLPAGTKEVPFPIFWRWFEKYVIHNDMVRAEVFEEASARRLEAERVAKEAEEKRRAREMALRQVLSRRQAAEADFLRYSEAILQNEEACQILNQGAVLRGAPEAESEGPPPKGEHVQLIRSLLILWGHSFASTDSDEDATWTVPAMAAWRSFVNSQPSDCGLSSEQIDSPGLERLISKDAFTENLPKLFHLQREPEDEEEEEEDDDDDEDEEDPDGDKDLNDNPQDQQEPGIDVTVVGISKDNEATEDDGKFFADVITEAGEKVRLLLSPEQVPEVQRRLEAGEAPVLAKADLDGARLVALSS